MKRIMKNNNEQGGLPFFARMCYWYLLKKVDLNILREDRSRDYFTLRSERENYDSKPSSKELGITKHTLFKDEVNQYGYLWKNWYSYQGQQWVRGIAMNLRGYGSICVTREKITFSFNALGISIYLKPVSVLLTVEEITLMAFKQLSYIYITIKNSNGVIQSGNIQQVLTTRVIEDYEVLQISEEVYFHKYKEEGVLFNNINELNYYFQNIATKIK